MALSGSFTGSTSNQYVKPKIAWSATQSIEGNYSNVSATLTYSRTNSGYTTSGKWSGSITINGTTVSGSSGNDQIYITQNSNTFAMTATVKVPHNADGSKSITISCTGSIPAASLSSTSCSATVALDTIPRQAKITAAYDFTDLDNPSFSFSNPGGFPMDVWLEPNPTGDHLCIRKSIPNTGSYTWTLTDAEREELRNKCLGQSCTIRFGLYSYVGSTTYSSYVDKKFTMKENDTTKPTVSVSTALNNGTLPSKFDGMYIQGKSRLDVSISAKSKYSASIVGYSATIGGDKYNSNNATPFSFLSNVLNPNKEGKVEVIGYAKDSRQFTGSASQEIEVVPYSKPSVVPIGSETAISCYRSDGNGMRIGNSTSVWVKAKRTHYSLSGKNNCALQWRRKLVTEAWNDSTHLWQDLIPKTDTSTIEYNALIPGEVFDLRTSYSVQIRVIDDIGEHDIKNFEIPTQDVALHLGKGGKNVSVGTYCDYSEDYTFYSKWKGVFDAGLQIGDTLISDHVVEQGTSGIWTFCKWNSGLAECWGTYTADGVNAAAKNYNGFYYSETILVDYPFEFTQIPVLQVNGGSSAHMNFARIFAPNKNQAGFIIIGNVGVQSTNITVNIHAIGRWK